MSHHLTIQVLFIAVSVYTLFDSLLTAHTHFLHVEIHSRFEQYSKPVTGCSKTTIRQQVLILNASKEALWGCLPAEGQWRQAACESWIWFHKVMKSAADSAGYSCLEEKLRPALPWAYTKLPLCPDHKTTIISKYLTVARQAVWEACKIFGFTSSA